MRDEFCELRGDECDECDEGDVCGDIYIKKWERNFLCPLVKIKLIQIPTILSSLNLSLRIKNNLWFLFYVTTTHKFTTYK